ncbi:MAG: hypothetical protein ACLP2Q_16030, partial [Steroidobacteraceae bacterium]
FGNLADESSEVARMWKAQQVEPALDKQKKDEQREEDEKLDKYDETLRGYRIFEDLRTYPSVVYLERIRSTEV